MMDLVGRDDRRGDLGAGEQLVEIGGEEVRTRVVHELAAELLLHIAQPEPADTRIITRELGADASDCAAADHREADFLASFRHRTRLSPLVDRLARARRPNRYGEYTYFPWTTNSLN